MTSSIVNDIKATEDNFIKAMGSGVAATAHLIALVQATVRSGQGGPIASAIARLNKKGDAHGARAVRSIVGAIFLGAKIGTAKDKKTIVLSLKDASIDADALGRLVAAGGDKLSIRDALVKRVKGEAEAKELDLVKYAEGLVKRMAKDGVTSAALIAAIQAAAAK